MASKRSIGSARRVAACAALAVVGTVGVAVPGAAAASQAPRFNGLCELTGTAQFASPVTNATTENSATFRSEDGLANCTGELEVAGKSLGSAIWPVRAEARASGAFSCIAGSLQGGASITVLGPGGAPLVVDGQVATARADVRLDHAVVGGTISFSGANGTSAGGLYNFTPSIAAIGQCAAGGDEALQMAVRFTTFGWFESLPEGQSTAASAGGAAAEARRRCKRKPHRAKTLKKRKCKRRR